MVDRIRDEVRDPRLEERLVHEVERGRDLSNNEAAKVYDIEVEPGVGVIRQFIIGPHAAYRMDLRSITVADVREALRAFVQEYMEAQKRGTTQFMRWREALRRGSKVEYLSPKRLFVVFTAPRPDQVKIVTTFWKGKPDPKPRPGQCDIRRGYQVPVSDLAGFRIKGLPPNGDSTKQQLLPSPEHSRSKPVGTPSFTTPGPGDKPVKDRVRTLPSPGEDSPKTEDIGVSVTLKRRHEAAMNGPPFPGANRQHEQRGQARQYYKRYYQKNRQKIRRRMKKWLQKNEHKYRFKKDRERRREHPERFKRRPGGGYRSNAERARDWRRNQKRSMLDLPFYHVPTDQYGIIHTLDEDGVVFLTLEGEPYETTLDYLLRDILPLDEEGHDRLFCLLDHLMEVEEELAVHLAEMVERDPVEVPPGQRFDRATPFKLDDQKDPTPGGMPEVPVHDNPGSARVIPYNRDFVNNRAAATISDIRRGCSPTIERKAQGLQVRRTRVAPKHAVWLFDVEGKSGVHRVRVKAIPKGQLTAVAKMDVRVSCSCPFWRWQGPEHWAKAGGYLFGKARGTATKPVVKDPSGQHRACHHVLAVLDRVSRFTVSRKNRGVRKLAAYLQAEAVERVARRYLLEATGRF